MLGLSSLSSSAVATAPRAYFPSAHAVHAVASLLYWPFGHAVHMVSSRVCSESAPGVKYRASGHVVFLAEHWLSSMLVRASPSSPRSHSSYLMLGLVV